jgi:hypothetical protein
MVLDRSCKPEVVPCLWRQGGPMMLAGDKKYEPPAQRGVFAS